MEELRISTVIYFEVKDSDFFGGYGTTGYSDLSFSHIVTENEPNVFKDNTFEHIKRCAKYMAEKFGVPVEKIRTISKEEYEDNADDD